MKKQSLLSTLLFVFIFGCATQEKLSVYPKTPNEVLKASKASDWYSPDPKNLLYMQLKSGLVVISLAPEFAPLHAENIAKLTQLKFWDKLVVMRSHDNYVAQWGDPDLEKSKALDKIKDKVKERVPAEFEIAYNQKYVDFELSEKDSYADRVGFYKHFPIAMNSEKMWLAHCYETVGVSRGNDINGGNGTSLYAVTGHSPRHLDRNITLVGRVIHGIEHLSSLPRGKGPLGFYKDKKKHHPIKSVRLGSDVPKKKRLNFKILRTSSETYKKWLAARKARKEEWFHRPAGHIDLCNAKPKIKVEK